MSNGNGEQPARGSQSALRDENRRLVVEVLRDPDDPDARWVTQPEIARRTGLSRATVWNVVDDLGGVDVETPTPDQRRRLHGGGRTKLLALERDAGAVIAADLGHSRIRVAASDLTGKVVHEHPNIECDVDSEPEESVARTADLIAQTLDVLEHGADRVVGVGVGLPGPVDDQGRVRSPGMPDWEGFEVEDELGHLLRRMGLECPIRIDNDANLAALAEKSWGAARRHRNVLVLKWSHGLGAGLILDGDLRRGADGIAGEFGHTPCLNGSASARCPRCLRTGCIEAVAGLDAMIESAGADMPGDQMSEEEFFARAKDGDDRCVGALEEAGELVGRALAPVVTMTNPRRVILGGLVPRQCPFAVTSVRKGLRKHAYLPTLSNIDVMTSDMTGTVVRGAVALVLDERLPSFLARIA